VFSGDLPVTERRVLISLNRFSVVGPSMVHVLRLAIGLASAYSSHQVTVVLHGEGVLCGLCGSNPAWVDRYLKSARAHKIELLVELEELTSRKIDKSSLNEVLIVISAEELLNRWKQSDLHLRV
jgi:hypothetical protein